MTGTYPFAGDPPLVRARRVARAYRGLAEKADAPGLADLDERIVGWGERWAVPTALLYDDHDWITAGQAAEVACVSVGAIGELRRRGRLTTGRPRATGRGFEYQAWEIYGLSAVRRRQH